MPYLKIALSQQDFSTPQAALSFSHVVIAHGLSSLSPAGPQAPSSSALKEDNLPAEARCCRPEVKLEDKAGCKLLFPSI